jgi:uncharacterized protein YdeI (YjbR/CyaY-like superfamily)
MIEGEPYLGTLMRMGGPDHILTVLKAIREKISRTFGDKVKITLEEDLEPRQVAVPPDFQEALDREPAAGAAFQKRSSTRQQEIVRGISEAKRAEMRHSRMVKAIKMLKVAKKSAFPGRVDVAGKEKK